MSLDGRVVIITGATGALGRVVAERFAAAGCRLVLAGTNQERLTGMAHDLGLAEDRWRPAVGNLRDAADARALATTGQAAFGRIDVLAHLVGGWLGGHPWSSSIRPI